LTGAALWLTYAVMLQGALAFALLWLLGNVRLPLIARGRVELKDMALSTQAWPEEARRVGHAFDNQFQLPTLFYVGCGISYLLGPLWFESTLAILFFVSRVVHAAVFVVSNHVPTRFAAFTAGYIILIVLWIDLGARVVGIAMGGR
jgi:hypothetical protein